MARLARSEVFDPNEVAILHVCARVGANRMGTHHFFRDHMGVIAWWCNRIGTTIFWGG